MKKALLTMTLLGISAANPGMGAPYNAAGPGDWISLGVPSRMYVGTDGDFYVIGTDMGTCSGTRPTYFRAAMSDPHFKEFYAFLLYATANQKIVDCVVHTGCGSNQLWVKYCAATL